MQRPCHGQLLLQRQDQTLRENRHSVFVAFATANDDFPSLEFNVLYAERQSFHQPHSTAVEHRGDQPHGATHVIQKPAHLRRSQHDRKTARVLNRDDLIQPRQLDLKDGAVQEQNCRLRLCLSRSSHFTLDCQVVKKLGHLRRPKLLWVPLSMEQNEAPNPLDVDFLGPPRVVSYPDLSAQQFKQPRLATPCCLRQ